jgi:hypothetical protein
MRRGDYEVTTMRRSESREDDKGKGRDAVNAGKMISGELLRSKVDILRRILIYTPQNVHFRSKQCGAHTAFCGTYSSMRQKNQRISVAQMYICATEYRFKISGDGPVTIMCRIGIYASQKMANSMAHVCLICHRIVMILWRINDQCATE